MHTRTSYILAAAGVLLAISGCARQEDQATQMEGTDTSPISAEAWVDDVQLSNIGADAAHKDDFLPGEPIELSMTVADAPAGTTVTAYWYGPGNQALGYEAKSVDPNQQELSFIQDNTLDWEHGAYRAEIWVGDEKVEEEAFEIIAG